MSIFFCTGLPRSRTSWISNFLNHGGSYCLHDGSTIGLEALEKEMVDILIRNTHLSHVGDSDSGLLLIADKVVDMFPSARWLFLKRARSACEASYRRHFEGYDPYVPPGTSISNIFDIGEQKYQWAISSVPKDSRMEIDVAELDNMSNLRDVQEWLIPGEPFCEDRAKMLNKLQVNPFAKKIKPFYHK